MDALETVKLAKTLGGFYQGEPASPDSVKKVVDFQGLKIKVDRPKGFIMFGEDSKGKPWKRKYKYDYGFIPKTLGGDGDGLDVFIGPAKKAKQTFWAVQRNDDGSFDEYKIFVGFDNRDEAIAAYRAHIPKKYFGRLITMSIEMMKAMLGTDPNEQVNGVKTSSWNGFFRELHKLADTTYFEEGMDAPVQVPPQMVRALQPQRPPPRQQPLVPSIMDIRHPGHDHLRLALLDAAISSTLGVGSTSGP